MSKCFCELFSIFYEIYWSDIMTWNICENEVYRVGKLMTNEAICCVACMLC